MDKQKYMGKFKRCILEYTNVADAYMVEDDEENAMPQDNMQQNNPAQDMGGDASMGGEMPMNGDASMGGEMPMNGDASMGGEMPMGNDASMGGEMPMGDDASMGGEMPMNSGGVEGFNPQGGEDMPMGDTMQPDDEVIDVDDLTKSQEAAEEKIDSMNAKFEKLMGAVETLIKQNSEREREAEKVMTATVKNVEDELNKRIPTPMQRMTMRSTKSAPYSMTPNEYMNNYAPENYSDADDNNGADDAQYQITKSDIDNFTDYASIAKELDIEHQNLHNILGF